MSKIIILCGIPASGKSTWALNYVSHNEWTTRIVSRDTIREGLIQPYIYTKQNEDEVTIRFNRLLKYHISQGFDVILDNTHCREKYIDEILNNKPPGYVIYIKFFDIPLWKACHRAIKRRIQTGKDVPISAIRRLHGNFKKINRKKYEGILL